ncbi:MAG TPA: site-specific DNA-methyltransferase, partial [Parabacteroides sp.]|nr:site-specific DNA-methyltransferase [Parabacteroides sp.]
MVVKQVKGEYKLYTKIRIKGDRPKTLWNRPEYSGTTGTNELKDLVSYNDFSYPKSVELVIDSLQVATDEDSIILDFFGGSGTTGQAVMDLNKRDNGSRKFILVEQMDYINTVSVPRLKAVIKKN